MNRFYLQIYSAGGTIDKVYFDANSTFDVGDPQVVELLKHAQFQGEYSFRSLVSKDSIDLTDDDRDLILDAVKSCDASHILITHGTDTIIETAKLLQQVKEKTIVLTGSMQPARLKMTDADFNIGFAVAAVQLLDSGVYIAINGQIFEPDRCKKNLEKMRFETLD